jgi:hypothetical protein
MNEPGLQVSQQSREVPLRQRVQSLLEHANEGDAVGPRVNRVNLGSLIANTMTLTQSIPKEFVGYLASTDPTLTCVDISLHGCYFIASMTPLLNNQTTSCLQRYMSWSLIDTATGPLPCTVACPLILWLHPRITWIGSEGSLSTI